MRPVLFMLIVGQVCSTLVTRWPGLFNACDTFVGQVCSTLVTLLILECGGRVMAWWKICRGGHSACEQQANSASALKTTHSPDVMENELGCRRSFSDALGGGRQLQGPLQLSAALEAIEATVCEISVIEDDALPIAAPVCTEATKGAGWGDEIGQIGHRTNTGACPGIGAGVGRDSARRSKNPAQPAAETLAVIPPCVDNTGCSRTHESSRCALPPSPEHMNPYAPPQMAPAHLHLDAAGGEDGRESRDAEVSTLADDSSESCTVRQDLMEPGVVTLSMPCAHAFHKECLMQASEVPPASPSGSALDSSTPSTRRLSQIAAFPPVSVAASKGFLGGSARGAALGGKVKGGKVKSLSAGILMSSLSASAPAASAPHNPASESARTDSALWISVEAPGGANRRMSAWPADGAGAAKEPCPQHKSPEAKEPCPQQKTAHGKRALATANEPCPPQKSPTKEPLS